MHLKELLQKQLHLYRQFSQLTPQLRQAIEGEDEELVLRLLKRRDTLLHRLREVSVDLFEVDLPLLLQPIVDEMRELLTKLIAADRELLQNVQTLRDEALRHLASLHGKKQVAETYRGSAPRSSRFVDTEN